MTVRRIAEHVCHLGIRTDEVQRAAVGRAAAREGVSVSEWCRGALQLVLDVEDEQANVFVQAHERRQR